MYNFYIAYLINHIKINSAQKNLKVKIIYTKKILFFLKFLKQINYVYKFFIFKKIKKLFIILYLYYFNKTSLVKNFKLISKPSKKYYISHSSLVLLKKRTGNSIFILSTNKGFITHTEAINNGIGGILLGFFFL